MTNEQILKKRIKLLKKKILPGGGGLIRSKFNPWHYSPTKNQYEHRNGDIFSILELEDRLRLSSFIRDVNFRTSLLFSWDKEK